MLDLSKCRVSVIQNMGSVLPIDVGSPVVKTTDSELMTRVCRRHGNDSREGSLNGGMEAELAW